MRCDHLTKEGCPELKAVLQWLAASEGRRSLLYFPFELKIGPAPLFARRDCLGTPNPAKFMGLPWGLSVAFCQKGVWDSQRHHKFMPGGTQDSQTWLNMISCNNPMFEYQTWPESCPFGSRRKKHEKNVGPLPSTYTFWALQIPNNPHLLSVSIIIADDIPKSSCLPKFTPYFSEKNCHQHWDFTFQACKFKPE